VPRRGRLRPLAIAGFIAGIGCIGGGLLLVHVLSAAVVWSLPFLAAYVAGLVACRAQPDNLAARRLLLFGVAAVGWLALSDALLLAVDSLGVRPWFALANALTQTAGLLMATSIAAMLVVYPDGDRGRLRRWIPFVLVGFSIALPLVLLLTRDRVEPAWILQWWSEGTSRLAPPASPLSIDALSALGPPAAGAMAAALGMVPVVGVVALALRYRKLDHAQRERVAWPLLAGLILVLLSVDDVIFSISGPLVVVLDIAEASFLVLLPASLGIGLVNPGLFDIVAALRQTVVYVTLSAFVVALYVAVAWMLGITVGQDNLRGAVIVAVLAALALDPVRRTLMRRVARFAYGEEIPRDELLRRLGETLEHTLDLGQLVGAIAAAAREGLGVRWVRVTVDGVEPVWEGEATHEAPAMAAPMRQGDDDLGRIECGPMLRGRPTAQSRALLETLARQAALALVNARLVGELERHLQELAASRERLVHAEESARRRLERDLHDGSQQELAALLARIALTRSQLRRDDAVEVARSLDLLQSDAQHALENLRELASGIHASVLADRGLAEAIEARVARLPLRVDVECGPGVRDGDLSDSVEGAAYFLVCEALANTLKHGDAQRATVRLRLESGMLRIDVIDDGCGFDPAEVSRRGGLAGLSDRLSALGGSLDVASRPGSGTRLEAAVPSRS
jgi:signal transduction histidine kinase